MKIPFDIKYRPQIESGEYKVETIDGHSVRIICWDAVNASDDDIVALVKSISGNENICRYYANGHLVSDSANMGNKDLVIVTPDVELSEWEKVVGLAIANSQFIPRDKDGIANIHDFGEYVKRMSDKLLSIARERFMKCVPRWRKATAGTRLPGDSVIRAKGEEPRFGCVAIRDCEYITVNDLNRLPSDERPTETSDKA